MSSKELFPTEVPLKMRPLAARLAPQRLEDFSGQEHLLGPGKMLRRLIEAGRVSTAIFFGPPGTGKTALARYIALKSNAQVSEYNAVVTGVAELKKALETARYQLAQSGQRTLLLMDEIHHFNRTQQDVLLPAVERGDAILIGMTTENPSFYVNAALLSRSTAFEFHPLRRSDLESILDRALKDSELGLGAMRLCLDAEARDHLLRMSAGDARKLLNAVELAALTTPPGPDGSRSVTLAAAEESIQRRSIRYDKRSDDHYDHISAFIKSMRGSDPDAALYWMAKMLAAGEDPRFIARRILICAAEDVGNADFRALLVAGAAFNAAEMLGMPEARIPLAQAAVYVACAPKSNAAYLGVDAALKEAREGPAREVPLHLRDANLDAESRGHGTRVQHLPEGHGAVPHPRYGKGYQYPHDFQGHWVEQAYMPDPVRFYRPTQEGDEARLAKRLDDLRKKRD